MIKKTVKAFSLGLMAIDMWGNTKMIKWTVEAFSLGLMAVDMWELVQKSSSAPSWFWSTHQISWMIILYERIMGEFKDNEKNGQGIETLANGDRYARASSKIIFSTFMILINAWDIVDDHPLWTNNGWIQRWWKKRSRHLHLGWWRSIWAS